MEGSTVNVKTDKAVPSASTSTDHHPIGIGSCSTSGKLFKGNPFGEELREMILRNKIEEPLVFRQIHRDWGPCKWTLGDWGDIFRDEKLTVRYGRQKWDHDCPQWEALCGNLEITWTRMIEWVRNEYSLPIERSSPSDIWMYYDYKYLPEVIHLKSESEKDFLKLIYLSENLKKMFCWQNMGFPDRNGDHSTLWIGTKGSYTNTHYDTYSCNLVCQVYGKKTWMVFPPCDTEHLKPARVPYEESSVYSQINLASRSQIQKNMEALSKCTPRKITLEPGDCLYLPPKWWHFVKSEDLSISVNTWVELPSDHFTRVEEAVLRAVVSSVVNSSVPSASDRILNPNEIDLTEVSDKDSEDTLRQAVKAYLEFLKREREEEAAFVKQEREETEASACDDQPECKKPKMDSDLNRFIQKAPVQIEKLKVCSLGSESEESESSSSRREENEPINDGSNSPPSVSDNGHHPQSNLSPNRSPTFLEEVLNAVGHPNVLKQIALQFLNNVKQRNSSN